MGRSPEVMGIYSSTRSHFFWESEDFFGVLMIQATIISSTFKAEVHATPAYKTKRASPTMWV
jgi:hypothetical protein